MAESTKWTGMRCPRCQASGTYIRPDSPTVVRCAMCGDTRDEPKRDVIGVDPLEGRADGGPHEARVMGQRQILPNLIDWTIGQNDRESPADPYLMEARGTINQKARELYQKMAREEESQLFKLLIDMGWTPPPDPKTGTQDAAEPAQDEREALSIAAKAVENSASVWKGFAMLDAKTCVDAYRAAIAAYRAAIAAVGKKGQL